MKKGLKIRLDHVKSNNNITGLDGKTSNQAVKKIFKNPLDIEITNARAKGNITGVKLNVDDEMSVKEKVNIKTDIGQVTINPEFGEVTFGKRG